MGPTLMLLSCKDDLLVTPDDSSAMFCRLGRYAVESYLEQILSHGFFHADPVSSCFWFEFWCYTKWLKYTYDLPIRTIFWNFKMIPEQKLVVLAYVLACLCFKNKQCLSECLLYGKLLKTFATNLRSKCVRAHASPRIVPHIFKCMSYAFGVSPVHLYCLKT